MLPMDMLMKRKFIVRAECLFHFEHFVRSHNGNPVALMKRVGLTPAQIRNPDNYIPVVSVADLFSLTAKELKMPLFGMHYALIDYRSRLGALSVALTTRKSLQEIIALLKDKFYVHNNSLVFDFSDNKALGIISIINLADPDGRMMQQLSLCQTQSLYKLLNTRLGIPKKDLHMNVMMSSPEEYSDEHHKHIQFSSGFNGVSFPIKYSDRSPVIYEEDVNSLVDNVLSKMVSSYPDNFETKCKHTMIELLKAGECSVGRLASTLGISIRNLQAALKKLNTSYTIMLKECRFQQACFHLSQGQENITNIAFELGFSDPSAFSREFKKWTGMSPQQWKNQQCPEG